MVPVISATTVFNLTSVSGALEILPLYTTRTILSELSNWMVPEEYGGYRE
jgi:hypothetical protein